MITKLIQENEIINYLGSPVQFSSSKVVVVPSSSSNSSSRYLSILLEGASCMKAWQSHLKLA